MVTMTSAGIVSNPRTGVSSAAPAQAEMWKLIVVTSGAEIHLRDDLTMLRGAKLLDGLPCRKNIPLMPNAAPIAVRTPAAMLLHKPCQCPGHRGAAARVAKRNSHWTITQLPPRCQNPPFIRNSPGGIKASMGASSQRNRGSVSRGLVRIVRVRARSPLHSGTTASFRRFLRTLILLRCRSRFVI